MGGLRQSEAVPQRLKNWGFAALSHQPPIFLISHPKCGIAKRE